MFGSFCLFVFGGTSFCSAVHGVVNNEDSMYDNIDAIPMDSEDAVNQALAIDKNHVSEIWSAPRVNVLAHEYGLQRGFSCDIQCNDENGEPWDFDVPAQRSKCVIHILEQQPAFSIGSPMCTAFRVLQGLNKSRLSK